jgi:transmembrane sensor
MKQSPMSVEALIQRFRNNECTPEELALLQQWVTQLDLSGESTDLSEEQLVAVKNRIYQQLVSARPPAIRRYLPYRRFLAAASWLLVIVSTAVLYYYIKPVGARRHKQSQLTVIENLQPAIRRITLPDGSQVCLNMNSRLEFDPEQFNRTERLLKLSGEGYFEVVPSIKPGTDSTRIPFIVETGSLRTRVLGTAFNIEAYDQESEVRVSLVHGKIALDDTATDRTTILSPNHSLRYSKQTQSWEVLPVEAATVALWTQGYLVFNEVPLKEAIRRISERYRVAIECDEVLVQNKRITASFQHSTWPAVLTNILFVHDLNYKKVGEKVMIVRTKR